MNEHHDPNQHSDDTAQLARSRIFVLLDGSFVVKWNENRVQELLTGQYRSYERRDFGASITDFELNQLKQAGIVDSFDKEFVWLSILPEHSVNQTFGTDTRVRSYYLHTTLNGNLRSDVEKSLERLGLDDDLHVRTRDDFVVILGKQGRAFANFDEAEEMRLLLVDQAPEVFQETVVAFIETTRRD